MVIRAQGEKRRSGRASIWLSVALVAFAAQSACGSEDDKKKQQPGPKYEAGGEGGADGAGAGTAGTKNQSGSATSGGEGATGAVGASGGSAGTAQGGEPGLGGASNEAGAAGAGPSSSCEPGTGDCDDNPDDCETDLTLLTSCGACGVTCSDLNGTVRCAAKGCEMTSCTAGHGDCNDSGTDGCETDLTTAANCGVCGHDCGGGACTNGLCAGTTLGAVIPAYRWVQAADAIYRFDCYTPGYYVSSDYKLVRTPLDGGAEVQMAGDAKGAGALTVDDQFVYWAVNGTPPAVFKKAHSAAANVPPTPMFEPASLPVQMKIVGGAMYWLGLDGALYTRLLTANIADAGSQLITAANVKGTGTFNLHQDFVATPTTLYWVLLPASGNQATIRSASLNGQNVADVPGAVITPWTRLWTSGEDLYWVRATGAALDGAYHFVNGGSVEALTIQSGLNGIVTAGAYYYLLQGADSLFRGPIAGGTAVKISTTSGMTDFGGVDANKVYTVQGFTHGAGFGPGTKIGVFPR